MFELNDANHHIQYETLRLYTPVAHITRGTATAVSLPIGENNYVVPANTVVMVSAACIHVNPDIYPAPLEFRPKRWLSTSSTGEVTFNEPEKFNFLPWSAGPR